MSDSPIVVSYGGGTNSTALLIGMRERGLRPALIMFADTGDEKPETYEHLGAVQSWLDTQGFPPITIVRNELPQGLKDGSLYGECLRLGTLPAKVFGRSSCSMKWKVEPQLRYQKRWMAERGANHVVHFVGYDADEWHRANKPASVAAAVARAHFERIDYPLIEWGWGRDECVKAITRAGLKQPGKSACFMCPSSRKPEVVWLAKTHPGLYQMATILERRALAGEGQAPVAMVKGLGRHWNWETLEGAEHGTPEPCMACYDGEGVEDCEVPGP